MKVLKWDVPVDDHDHLIGGGKVVHVACQRRPEVVQVWTEETDESLLNVGRRARVYGTGQEIQEGDKHLGSVVTHSGNLVWHVYGKVI